MSAKYIDIVDIDHGCVVNSRTSLAYVVREDHRTIIVQFSDRFPKASLVTNVVKTTAPGALVER